MTKSYISVADATAYEGDDLNFVITRSGDVSEALSIYADNIATGSLSVPSASINYDYHYFANDNPDGLFIKNFRHIKPKKSSRR